MSPVVLAVGGKRLSDVG